MMEPTAAIEAKSTKTGNGHLTKRVGPTAERENVPAEAGLAPNAEKAAPNYRRIFLWICLSAAFLGSGCLASGLLSQEESPTWAILLFCVALVGAAGCMYFFFRLLREISPRARSPFISTLH
jgi:hypothetical protein